MSRSEEDYRAASEWAETAKIEPGAAVTGAEAADIGREMLRRAGRPALDPDGESVALNVRVPRRLRDSLDAYAETHHDKVSAIVRNAVVEYLDAHS